MVIVDTHCHASPYWYAPVESLLHEMSRAGVDKALLVQIGGIYDNSYLIECMRRFPGRFSVVAMVDTDLPDAPQRLEELSREGDRDDLDVRCADIDSDRRARRFSHGSGLR